MWIFVTDSGSWFVWRKQDGNAWVYKNLNKRTGEVTLRWLYSYD